MMSDRLYMKDRQGWKLRKNGKSGYKVTESFIERKKEKKSKTLIKIGPKLEINQHELKALKNFFSLVQPKLPGYCQILWPSSAYFHWQNSLLILRDCVRNSDHLTIIHESYPGPCKIVSPVYGRVCTWRHPIVKNNVI